MKLVKLRTPKKLKTATFVFGLNVQGKDIIEVPEDRVALFKQLGYKEIKEKKKWQKHHLNSLKHIQFLQIHL